MPATSKRKTSITLTADALDDARTLGVNVSAVADKALKSAVAEARQRKWQDGNADAFAAQAAWHEQNGHPLKDILVGPGLSSWND